MNRPRGRATGSAAQAELGFFPVVDRDTERKAAARARARQAVREAAVVVHEVRAEVKREAHAERWRRVEHETRAKLNELDTAARRAAAPSVDEAAAWRAACGLPPPRRARR